MTFKRFVFILPVVLALSACGGDSKPAPTATAQPAPAAPKVAAVQPPTPAVQTPKPAPVPVKAASKKALAPLMGTWSADLGGCGGMGTITISAKEFSGAENACSISSFGDNGDGTFTAAMDCDSQGQKTSERIVMNPVFAPTGEGITMTYVDRGNEEVTVLRCDAGDTAAAE
jgi:hypothetical protein